MKKTFFWLLLMMFCAFNTKAQNIEVSQSGRFAVFTLTGDDYAHWLEDAFSNDRQMVQRLSKQLYQKFNDDFDFIVYVLNEDELLPSFPYYGISSQVRITDEGVGNRYFDNSKGYGSDGRLFQVLHLPYKNAIESGPFLHEIFHHWGNFAIPTIDFDNEPYGSNGGSHWGVTGGSGKGQLGGFVQSEMKKDGNTYTIPSFGLNASGGNGVPYNELELYLMGLIPVSEVSPFSVFRHINSYSWDKTSRTFTIVADDVQTYTPQRLESELGKRVPDYTTSQKEFNAMFVVLTLNPLTNAQIKHYDEAIERFCRVGDDGQSWLYNFYEATGGRAKFLCGDLHESVKGDAIRIISPNTNTPALEMYSTYSIEWNASVSGNVKIQLMRDGAPVKTIASNIPALAGKYEWIVDLDGSPNYTNYYIKVTSENNGQVYAESAKFNVKVPDSEICSINGHVYDFAGKPVSGAWVTSGSKLPSIDCSFEDAGNSGYMVSPYQTKIEFQPSNKVINQFSFRVFTNQPTLVDGLTTGIINKDQEILYSVDLTADQVKSSLWTEVDIPEGLIVTPGETYYIFLYDNNADYNTLACYFAFVGKDDASKYCYRVTTSDGVATKTNSTGAYSLRQSLNWSGKLRAFADGMNFSPIDIQPLAASAYNIDFYDNVTLNTISVTAIKTEFFTNETINKTFFTVTGNYSNGKAVKLSQDDFTISPTSFATAGTHSITITSGDKSAYVSVKIEAPKLDYIAVTPPTKNTYFVGDAFDKSGMVVTAYYDNNTTADVTSQCTLSGFDSETAGTKTVTATFDGKSATFSVTIKTPEIVDYTFVSPSKTTYQIGEEFSNAGFSLVANYENGVSVNVTDQCAISGFQASKAGKFELTFTYKDFVKVIQYEVEEPKLDYIAVTPPTKTTYFVGDAFEKSGMVVTAHYDNNTTADVTSQCTLSGFDSETAGSKTVTATFDGKSATFSVTIKTPEIVDYTFVSPSKTTYQ
ncbi:MAG: bacterial Ig-like domain-containing protein, partial [Bacteroidales bacterium]|nr:bacterial Ig-like domain-containing protein [Bacteroidales bacterium]